MRTIVIDGELHLAFSEKEIVNARFSIDGDSFVGKGAETLPLPKDIPMSKHIPFALNTKKGVFMRNRTQFFLELDSSEFANRLERANRRRELLHKVASFIQSYKEYDPFNQECDWRICVHAVQAFRHYRIAVPMSHEQRETCLR